MIYEGFAYYKERSAGNGATYYSCTRKKTDACPVRLIIYADSTCRVSYGRPGEHTHDPDPSKVAAFEVKDDMFDKAAFGTSVREVVLQTHQSLPMSTVAMLPKQESSVRWLNSIRSRSCHARIAEPKQLSDIIIPPTLTLRGEEQLLMHDSGAADKERFFMFSSNKCLQYLSETNAWLVDGTFTVPSYFRQLWIIHACFRYGAVPCAYFLLPSKSTDAYRNALAVLKVKKPDINPSVVVADFEMAERTALRLEYGVAVYGCWFHLSQSVMRKTKELKLLFHFQCNIDQQRYTRGLWALTLVAVEDVPEVFLLLKAKALHDISEKTPEVLDRVTELFDYFERNYIRDKASFPPSMWNWFDWSSYCSYRSTGEAEAHNRVLKNKLSHRKADVGFLNDIIPTLVMELGLSETKGAQKQIDKKKSHTFIDTKEDRIAHLLKTYSTTMSDEAKLEYLLHQVDLMIAFQQLAVLYILIINFV